MFQAGSSTNSVLTTNSVSTTSTTTKTITSSPIYYVGCSRTNYQQYIPHPSDCSKFIRCIIDDDTGDISEAVEQCPGGTLYDSTLKLCNW